MLENKVALVTGVSKGIGLELVKLLVGRSVTVVGWSRSAPDYTHEKFHFIKADVSDEDDVERAYQETVDQVGQDIHFLVNNAGFGVFGSFEEMSSNDWKSMFDTNVHGIFYVTKKVVPQMKVMDTGHIINISSIAGLNGVKSAVGYVGTKHAVRGISHSLYMELRDFGIKVSCVYPGSVNTNFFDKIDAIQPSDNMMSPADVAKSVIELLDSSPNYFPVDLEVRPLRPKGKPAN